jgi:hypothetical protein
MVKRLLGQFVDVDRVFEVLSRPEVEFVGYLKFELSGSNLPVVQANRDSVR